MCEAAEMSDKENFIELIRKKRDGGEYTRDDINFIVQEIVSGTLADVQIGE